MPVDERFVSAISSLVGDMAQGNVAKLRQTGVLGRLTANELKQAIDEYGRTLVPLPPEAFDLADSWAVQGSRGTWAVDIPLWTIEEGRSDLTLSLTVCEEEGSIRIEIDDLHVM